MLEFNIAIHSFSEVREFFSLTTAQSFDVFVDYEHQIINAKGFIGMVSQDFSRP